MCEICFLTTNVNLRVGDVLEQKIAIICGLHTVEKRKELRKLQFAKLADFVLTAIVAF